MRRISKKRQRRMNECREFRRELIRSVGKCEACGASPLRFNPNLHPELSQLCCHEIANGPLREKAMDKPFAILVICFYCNQYQMEDKKLWPEPRQLALLKRSRPEDYDLQAYNSLVNPSAPNRITEGEVSQWNP